MSQIVEVNKLEALITQNTVSTITKLELYYGAYRTVQQQKN
jgi:hypothetical protein